MLKTITWMLRLGGDPTDLRAWRELFHYMKDPSLKIETNVGTEEYFLLSSRFDAIQERNDVIDIADHLLNVLNGSAAIICDTPPLKLSGLRAVYEDGTHKDMSPHRPAARVTLRFGVPMNTDGSPPNHPSNSQLIAESILKNNDTKASEVMRHYAIDQSWYELWKAFEIIEDDVERAVMVINKWASKKEMGAFAKSAQYHRHTTYSKRVRGI